MCSYFNTCGAIKFNCKSIYQDKPGFFPSSLPFVIICIPAQIPKTGTFLFKTLSFNKSSKPKFSKFM